MVLAAVAGLPLAPARVLATTGVDPVIVYAENDGVWRLEPDGSTDLLFTAPTDPATGKKPTVTAVAASPATGRIAAMVVSGLVTPVGYSDIYLLDANGDEVSPD